MTRVVFELYLILMFCLFPFNHSQKSTQVAEKERLFEEYFDWKLRNFPSWAVKIGIHKYDHLMEDYSEEAFHKRLKDVQNFIQRSNQWPLDPYMKILRLEGQMFVDGFSYSHYLFPPVNFMESIQNRLPSLYSDRNFLNWNTREDVLRNLEKLGKIPKYVNEVILLLKKGVENGLTYSKEAVLRTQSQFDKLLNLTNISNSEFLINFINGSNFDDTEGSLEDKARDIVQFEILPKFKELYEYLSYNYTFRPQPGFSTLPNGKLRYQASLAWHSTIPNVEPEEIHEQGLEEVSRLKKEFSDVIQKTFHSSLSIKEFFAEANRQSEYSFNSKEEVLTTYQQVLRDKINPALSQVFHSELITERVEELHVEQVPPDGPGGFVFYRSPSADGKRPGTFYVNLNDLNSAKKYDVMTLALHEGNPGHHMHAVTLERNNVPDFLKYSFYRGALSEAPSRLPVFTAYMEGWALYCEYLGLEMGLYDKDPFMLIGFYSFNLLRASRLVVDTGLHYKNWSISKARNYLRNNTALSDTAIKAEIDRYITWPGQATSYKIGEMAIKRLRQKLSLADIKDFHSYVLSCIGPIGLLEECVTSMKAANTGNYQFSSFFYTLLVSLVILNV